MTDAALSPSPPAIDTNWFSLDRLRIFRADVLAGVTVAAISLPQSMAYALIAGVDPRFGLYTAIVFTAVAALFGSSRHLINGPTGAVSLVVFSALAIFEPEVKLDSYEAMFLLAIMIGVVQIFIGVTKLGDITRYISESVIIGFITGAATLTIIGQVANALGVKAQGSGHQHVLERLFLTLTQPAPYNYHAMTISGLAIVLALLSRRLVKYLRLPQLDMFFVLIIVSLVAYFAGWSITPPGGKPAIPLIETVPSSLPGPHIPEVRLQWALDMSFSATAIAILGLLEALAIAKAIAHKSRQQLDYNRQCLAEGIGNLVGGFFRCMPGAGSLSRTAINYQAGAMTRFSGLYTALVVALTVMIFAPLTAYIPKAALAGLLVVSAARLIDIERLRYTLRGSRYDAILLIATAFSAIAISIEFAILIGSAVSIAWYLTRASKLKAAELIVTPERVVRARIETDPPSQGVLIYDIEGELFFGAAPDLERYLEKALHQAWKQNIKYIVLRLKRVRNPDVVALEVLDTFLKDAKRENLTVLLAGIRPDLFNALQQIGIAERLGTDFIFPEEAEDYSATLRAIRNAYALAARDAKKAGSSDWIEFKGTQLAYYLV
ncbi:SulP family inorganic anion transporter [Beijerinckia indica]|uniref:Sulphate transporter n=1 Tax=Beijerinckia indica subsp. indica (strain ATCC 9039 / DSM 1715 / NCIMB 8712) TaxID=395963 RepID=B2ICP6_BEII9|nr:SulP family inorganic anion transporter [Beijerinckia indica]ACB95320.1 sulphate transporter [Beijerinckia indica subsp. indica ATCC 9039]